MWIVFGCVSKEREHGSKGLLVHECLYFPCRVLTVWLAQRESIWQKGLITDRPYGLSQEVKKGLVQKASQQLPAVGVRRSKGRPPYSTGRGPSLRSERVTFLLLPGEDVRSSPSVSSLHPAEISRRFLGSTYCCVIQLSIFLAVLPDHTLPFWLATPPPPSDTVTLQWMTGGSTATPIGELGSGIA